MAVVLAPLGWAKYQTGRLLRSHALMGDATLSAVGAVLGVVALLGLLTDQLFDWRWADRVAALAVAVVASAEAIRVIGLAQIELREGAPFSPSPVGNGPTSRP